jgi:hypothetical protein
MWFPTREPRSFNGLADAFSDHNILECPSDLCSPPSLKDKVSFLYKKKTGSSKYLQSILFMLFQNYVGYFAETFLCPCLLGTQHL